MTADILDRVRALLEGRPDVAEKRMVGGRSFSLRDRMFCGVNRAGLVVRVLEETRDAVLAEPHVRPLVIGGRQPLGFVVVEPAGCATDSALAGWVERALAAVASHP
jgi:TfoX/Sxy family transcriptional regulator of competence genes